MKTKEEIFDGEFYFLQNFLNLRTTPPRLREIVIGCMEKYADQIKAEKMGLPTDEEINVWWVTNIKGDHSLAAIAKFNNWLKERGGNNE